ncbi:hypothetical protein ACKENX_16260 [Acinetobacter baumannii]|uniref:hypothetical protein n=1 Tax=Acinetobacter baumannii TaxID=470 RepID=UPI0038B552B4
MTKPLSAYLDHVQGVIKCPICSYDYTHQGKVEIFERGDDDEQGNHVQVLNDGINVDRDLTKNPSPRRQGVTIHMTCEVDRHPFKLNIYQHKGQTFVEVEV